MDVASDGRNCAFEAGAAAWPGVPLSRQEFDSAWDRLAALRRDRAGSDVSPRHAAASAPDCFLAIACDAGVPGAWAAFERGYLPRLRGLLRKRGATEAEAAELFADLPGYLCEPPADGRARTRIGTFDASGSLFSWLAVMVLRNVEHRRRDDARGPGSLDVISDVEARRAAPASAAIGEETVLRFELAITAAWRSLTPRERLAVLLKHRDGLSGREIAVILGVGEPRVSRLLDAGLARLRDSVRGHMPETPPGTSTPEQAVWQALSEVLARHLATLDDSSHHQAGQPDD